MGCLLFRGSHLTPPPLRPVALSPPMVIQDRPGKIGGSKLGSQLLSQVPLIKGVMVAVVVGVMVD